MLFKDDYAFGTAKEDDVLTKINKHFKDNITKAENPFSIYDYKGEKYYYELKSRRNCYKDFTTTLIGRDKIFTDNQRFIFQFIDGLYYIDYELMKFAKYNCKPFKRHLRGDYNDQCKLYYFIPIEDLKKIE